MELLILIGGAYALYTVGMAIATELDYRAFNRSELKQLRKQNDEILAKVYISNVELEELRNKIIDIISTENILKSEF